MTLLGREEIREALGDSTPIDRRLFFTPLLDDAQIGPASVDLRLGTTFFVMRHAKGGSLDPARLTQEEVEELQERIDVPLGERLWLHPGHFVLGATLEYMRIPVDMGGYVLARSSWGRIGLLVATAVMVQPGYTGTLTLELVNHGGSPIALYPGLRVAQLAIHRLEAPVADPYSSAGKYSSPTGPQISRLAWDRSEMDKVQELNRRLSSLGGK